MTDIEKLTEDLEYARYHCISNKGKDAINDAIDHINRQQADNERLKKLLEEADVNYNKCAKRFYKEAIKEFAEEIDYEILHKEFWKDHPYTSQTWLNGYEQCLRDIRVMLKDETKEMVGEQE